MHLVGTLSLLRSYSAECSSDVETASRPEGRTAFYFYRWTGISVKPQTLQHQSESLTFTTASLVTVNDIKNSVQQ